MSRITSAAVVRQRLKNLDEILSFIVDCHALHRAVRRPGTCHRTPRWRTRESPTHGRSGWPSPPMPLEPPCTSNVSFGPPSPAPRCARSNPLLHTVKKFPAAKPLRYPRAPWAPADIGRAAPPHIRRNRPQPAAHTHDRQSSRPNGLCFSSSVPPTISPATSSPGRSDAPGGNITALALENVQTFTLEACHLDQHLTRFRLRRGPLQRVSRRPARRIR